MVWYWDRRTRRLIQVTEEKREALRAQDRLDKLAEELAEMSGKPKGADDD